MTVLNKLTLYIKILALDYWKYFYAFVLKSEYKKILVFMATVMIIIVNNNNNECDNQEGCNCRNRVMNV